MGKRTLVLVACMLLAGFSSAQEIIFTEDFEWGSICAWSNLWFQDVDGDQWGANGVPGIPVSCPPPTDYVTVRGDCDDYDDLVFPGAIEVCDFKDNDCNLSTEDGADELWLEDICDGTDTDLCSEGVFGCQSGIQECSDTTGNTPDLCDGSDNDCNSATPDGADEPWLTDPCDGADSDLCAEGIYTCAGGLQICSDNSGPSFDLCNGVDDDCDPASADGSEDPVSGTSCDGPDSDLCLEGVYNCAAGSFECSDLTGSTADVCNGIDDDCDAASADGSEDPLIGAACDGLDSDLCLEGVYSCGGGALVCSDSTGSTTELCNGIDDDCNGAIDDGIIRDNNPLCIAGPENLGSVSGDTNTDVLNHSRYNEAWLSFTVTEDDDSDEYLSADIELISPTGVDFDLYVYCVDCGGSLAGFSSNESGIPDTVTVRRDDSWASDNSFDVIVEVRHYSSTLCANWTLTIQGNTAASSETCP